MKTANFLRIISIGLPMVLVAGMATADQKPTLALSKIGGDASGSQISLKASKGSMSYTIDLLPGAEEIAALNFDVKFEGNANIAIDNCGVQSAKHTAMCKMVAKDTLRVLVFSVPAAPMAADSVVQFSVSGAKGRVSIDESSVSISDMKGTTLESSVL